MKRTIFRLIVFFGTMLMLDNFLYAAHILEPLGTEIAATPPRGRMFGQMEYLYSKEDPDNGAEVTSHVFPVEFEVGVGERTQLNFEASVLLEKKVEGVVETDNGIQELAFGLKHRFLDETPNLPDAAFLVEFAPAAGLKGDEAELKATFLMTKNLTNRFLVHVETGYLLETEREVEVEGTVSGTAVTGEGKIKVENTNIFVYNVAPTIRVIPDRLLLLAELNGESNFRDNINDVTISPEVIFVIQNMALKFRVPIGLTDEANDIAIHFGISKLF